MSMMELQSALGGAPGGGPPGGGPASMQVPSLADAAAQAGPGGAGEESPEEQYTSTIDALDDAENALHYFIQNDPDEADRAEATKALQVVIKLKASNAESAQQGDMKSLRRALAGGGGAPAA